MLMLMEAMHTIMHSKGAVGEWRQWENGDSGRTEAVGGQKQWENGDGGLEIRTCILSLASDWGIS